MAIFISNPDSSPYSFYYNFCKLFEDSNFSPVERNKNINLMDNEEYEEMMDLKHHRIQ